LGRVFGETRPQDKGSRYRHPFARFNMEEG